MIKIYSKKKWMAMAMTALMMTATSPVFASANDSIQIKVNGSAIAYSEAPSYVDAHTNRTMVPVRFVSEALGQKVDWNAAGQLITITGKDKKISLHVNDPKVSVSGTVEKLDQVPVVKNSRTYVPLRFVSQALGAKVNYSSAENLVSIQTQGGAPASTTTQQQSSVNLPSKSVEDSAIDKVKEDGTKTFADLLALAQENSLDVQQAKLDMDHTKDTLNKAISDEDLSVNDLIGSGGSPDSVAKTKVSKDLGVKMAKDSIEVLNKKMDTLTLQLKKELEDDYLTYLQDEESYQIATQSLAQAQKNYKVVQLNYQQGMITKSDLLSAEATVAQANFNVEQAKNDVQTARETLNQLINQPLDQPIPAIDQNLMEQVDLSKYPVDKIIEIMKQQNPDYLTKLNTLETDQDKYDIYMFIYRNRYNSSVLDQDVTIEKDELAIQQAERDMEPQIRSAVRAIDIAKKQLDTNQKSLESAKEALRVAQAKFDSGISIDLDVLKASVAEMNAEKAYIQAKYDIARKYRDLYYTIGQELK